jgi:hypothetical protein
MPSLSAFEGRRHDTARDCLGIKRRSALVANLQQVEEIVIALERGNSFMTEQPALAP